MNRKQKRAKRMKARQHVKEVGHPRDVGGTREQVRRDRGSSSHLNRARELSTLASLGVKGPAQHHGTLTEPQRALLRGELPAFFEHYADMEQGAQATEGAIEMLDHILAHNEQTLPSGAPDIMTSASNTKWKNDSELEIIPGTADACSGPRPTRVHQDEVELMSPETFAGSNVPPFEDRVGPAIDAETARSVKDRAHEVLKPFMADAEIIGRMPTQQEWDDMVALAKKRKRGIAKMAEKAGWVPLNVAIDLKTREAWTVQS